jgi:hypothetical protein
MLFAILMLVFLEASDRPRRRTEFPNVRGYAGESYDRRQEGRNLSPYTLSASSV